MKATTEKTVQLETNQCHCQLEFMRRSDNNELYPFYELRLTIAPDLRKALDTMSLNDFFYLVRGGKRSLKQWAQQHPYCFLCLYKDTVWFRFFDHLGFICDGRADTYIAYVDGQGNFTSFPKMLNLVNKEHLYTNELWRLIKDYPEYYEGEFFNPVDRFTKIIESSGLGGNRPEIIIEQDNSRFIQKFLEKTQGKRTTRLTCHYALPLGGKGSLRATTLGSNELSIWVFRARTMFRPRTKIATIYQNYIYVQGFIIHEEDGIKYELTPEIANIIVKAINDINLEECED
ncbi:hypothetical protein FRE64_16595 (plasmid) [Euhalothece natronophila Z-M001]|uniref:Uncharacterized protein n=1 Tax=Euhalothece natronophila Z-M001 TaxID=522448 RepID=A0A5B8NQV9_9CHRO|nr:hypothetical protein [Euhalothece natronophila]QDZ41592.1 hypothetical protein FRE64_16595 [Euhalothece natronophila Z-M001]